MKISTLFLAMTLALAATQADAQKNDKTEIKAMSYNIRYGAAKDGTNSWQYRYPATALMIEDEQPDIIGVQEALDYQVKFIPGNFSRYKAIGVGRDNGKTKGEYTAVIYNKKVLKINKWGTFWLSEKPEKPTKGWDAACKRTATWAIVRHKKSKEKFIFVNTHLDHVGIEARKKGLELILRKIDEINKDGLPVILTGDFNVNPSDPCLEILTGKMESARTTAEKTDRTASFNNWGKSNDTIDYIYISGFGKCLEFKTVTQRYADRKFISDHYPIIVRVEL